MEAPGFSPAKIGDDEKWLQPRSAGAKALFKLHILGTAKAVPFHHFLLCTALVTIKE